MPLDEYVVTFYCGDDQLMGVLHHAPQAGPCVAVFVVGGPQYRVGSHRMFVQMARGLAAQNTAALRFDVRGMGDSDGEFHSFENLSEDIRAAIDEAERRLPGRAVVLIGLCDGASACAMYAAGDSRVVGVVLLNPWVRSDVGEAKARLAHYYRGRLLTREFWRSLLAGEVNVRASVSSFARGFAIALKHSSDVATQDFIGRMLFGLRDFRGAITIVLSGEDLTAREFAMLLESSAEWRELSRRSNVTIDHLADADHTFSGAGHLEGALRRTQETIAAIESRSRVPS